MMTTSFLMLEEDLEDVGVVDVIWINEVSMY